MSLFLWTSSLLTVWCLTSCEPLAYWQTDVSFPVDLYPADSLILTSCGLSGRVGLWCGMGLVCGWVRLTGWTSWEQCLWSQHRWWDSQTFFEVSTDDGTAKLFLKSAQMMGQPNFFWSQHRWWDSQTFLKSAQMMGQRNFFWSQHRWWDSKTFFEVSTDDGTAKLFFKLWF